MVLEPQEAAESRPRSSWLTRIFFVLLALLSLGIGLFAGLEGFGYYLGRHRRSLPPPSAAEGEKPPTAADLKKKNAGLAKQLAGLAPRGNYIVIDTARNLLFLKKGDEVLLKSVVSTGSGVVLTGPVGDKQWTFDTPRGEFSVKSKATDPVWVKPDWAFYEEGEGLPKKYSDRMEEGMMGDYALGIGDGYFIHGTLYTRLLGRNVTHGCVRVGDKDLEYLFRTVPLGAKVFIY